MIREIAEREKSDKGNKRKKICDIFFVCVSIDFLIKAPTPFSSFPLRAVPAQMNRKSLACGRTAKRSIR